jgi:hypothetical protein
MELTAEGAMARAVRSVEEELEGVGLMQAGTKLALSTDSEEASLCICPADCEETDLFSAVEGKRIHSDN